MRRGQRGGDMAVDAAGLRMAASAEPAADRVQSHVPVDDGPVAHLFAGPGGARACGFGIGGAVRTAAYRIRHGLCHGLACWLRILATNIPRHFGGIVGKVTENRLPWTPFDFVS